MPLRIIDSLEKLQGLKPFWQCAEARPNCDYELFQLVCRVRGEVKSPYVIVWECNGNPAAIFCARIQNTYFKPRIGYFNPIRLPAVILAVLHEGPVGEIDRVGAGAVANHLHSLLISGKVDAVSFSHLPEFSPLISALTENASAWRQVKPAWSTHRSITLGSEPGFLLKSQKPKHRADIRKQMKQLESAFPGKVSWKWMDRFEEISELCARFERVAARSYQRGLGAGFIDGAEFRAILSLFASRRQLRTQLLEIDGALKAYWFGVVYRGVCYGWATAYDPDLRTYSPGTLIFLRVLDELCKEGVRKFDFGLGDAHYKERFATESWREASLTLYAPSLKGFALRSAMGFFETLDRAGRECLRKTGILERVKTGWRRRLSSS